MNHGYDHAQAGIVVDQSVQLGLDHGVQGRFGGVQRLFTGDFTPCPGYPSDDDRQDMRRQGRQGE